MKGNIYTDERCPAEGCGAKMVHDERRGGCFCPEHPKIAATSRFLVVFGRGARKRCPTYAEAERYLNNLRFQVDQGVFDPRDYAAGNPMSMRVALSEYLKRLYEYIDDGQMRSGTLKSYRPGILRAIEFFGDRNLRTVKGGDIRDFFRWIRQQGKSEKTAKNDVDVVRAFYGDLVEREELTRVEVPNFPKIKAKLGMRKIISLEVQEAVLDEIERTEEKRAWLACLILARHANVRPKGLLMAEERDLDLELGTIYIRYDKDSDGKTLNLLDDEIDMLRSFPRGFPSMRIFRHDAAKQGCAAGQAYGINYLNKIWGRACKKLGVKGVPIYPGTKHSTLSAVGNAINLEAAKALSGHKTNAALMRYYQRSRAADIKTLSARETLIGKSPEMDGKRGKQVVNINEAPKNHK